MALGRVACKATSVILAIDPGVLEGSDYEAYAESNYTDRSKLVLDPADPPTEFVLQQLTTPQKAACEAEPVAYQEMCLRIRCALTGIKGYKVVRADGSDDTLADVPRRRSGNLGDIVERRWFEETFAPTNVLIVALNAAIMHLSEAQLPLSKPSGRPSGPSGSESQESSAA